MHDFDEAATEKFFNQEFAPLEKGLMKDTPLRSRDHLFLNAIKGLPRGSRILDFGCGQGRLLGTMLNEGFDATGVEKHEGMRAHAQDATGSPGRVLAGGVDLLADMPGESFDVVLMMGVLQYLSEKDYSNAIGEVRRILKPDGVFYATFQNSLFDLFTFNKYTVDFFMHGLVGPHLRPGEVAGVESAVRRLITNHAAPTHASTRARDNVFVRLTNPLTVADEVQHAFGLVHQATMFYEWFGLPPLLNHELGEVSKRIAEDLARNPGAWQGNFMANAFLASFKVAKHAESAAIS